MTSDDLDGVNSNIEDLGAHGALRWATKELSATRIPAAHKRRMLVLTIRRACDVLRYDMQRGRRLAAAHTVGMRTLGVKVALLLVAGTAYAQQPQRVYTNVVDGQPQRTIVMQVRVVMPATPVPASLPGTPLPPPRWRPEIGGTSYVPPQRAAAPPAIPAPPPQPWFVNGIYVGNAPSGNWTSTVIGRPIVDVNVIGVPRRPR